MGSEVPSLHLKIRTAGGLKTYLPNSKLLFTDCIPDGLLESVMEGVNHCRYLLSWPGGPADVVQRLETGGGDLERKELEDERFRRERSWKRKELGEEGVWKGRGGFKGRRSKERKSLG